MNAQTKVRKPDLSSGNPKAISVRVKSNSGGQVGGSRRHMLRIAPIPKYIDKNKIHLNSILLSPLKAKELRDICTERRAQRGMERGLKRNAALAFEGIITFGHEAQADFEALSVEEQNKAYHDVAEAIAKRVGSTLSGLVAHRDESAPHAHFQMPAFDLNGKPLNQTIKRNVTRDIQTIASDVIKQHVQTIERGRDKYVRLANGADYADVINKAVSRLHTELPLEIDALEVEADAWREKIEKNMRLAAKSAEKAVDNEKAAKRGAAYERRAEAAREALRALEGRIGDLRRKQEELRVEEQRLEPVKRAVEAMDAFKTQLEEFEAYQEMDVFKIEAVEESEVFQRRFNKLNPMADLGGEYVKALDVRLNDKDGIRARDWYFKLPDDVASFLKSAFDAALAAGKELWVQVTEWNGNEPTGISECSRPPAKPRIARDVIDLLASSDERTINAIRAMDRQHSKRSER